MSRKKNMLLVTAGILAGVTMTGPAAHAAAEYLKALPSAQSFYLDGAQVALEAYAINGRNYIQLVELGHFCHNIHSIHILPLRQQCLHLLLILQKCFIFLVI